MRHIFSVLATLLIVGAALSAATGPALGQTTGAYTHTFTSGDGQYVVDVGDYSGQIHVEMTTPEVPGPDNTVYATTLSGPQLDSGRIRLVNQGVYDNLTVTVIGPSSEPTWDSGGIQVASSAYTLGSTGGDADMQCGTLESARSLAWTSVVDCTGYPGIDNINTTSTDANQTKIDIYQDGLDQQANNDNSLTIMDNYLEDTETTARIIGQNAYIRALNNGSSQASARVEARSAISDYYAVKQENLISSWQASISNYQYIREVGQNESGISVNTVADGYSESFIGIERGAAQLGSYALFAPEWGGTTDTNVSLVNNDVETVTEYTVEYSFYDDGPDTYSRAENTSTFSVTSAETLSQEWSGETTSTSGSLVVRAPNDNYQDNRVVHDPQRFAERWAAIEEQNQQVQNDLDTIVNNTYDQYQAGEINNSDLVDPYTLSQRSANDSYESWAATQLTYMGANSPENFENTGSFEVNVTNGPTYEGILFVTEEMDISAGEAYNSSNLNGTEYIVTANETVELTGTWTVSNITDTDGNSVNSTTYEDTTYESANVSQLIEEYENLAEERAEIEAREQNLQSSSGGTALFGAGQTSLLVMMLLGGGVVFYIMREGDDN